MKRFQNILCVVDPTATDQFALDRAVELAERNAQLFEMLLFCQVHAQILILRNVDLVYFLEMRNPLEQHLDIDLFY